MIHSGPDWVCSRKRNTTKDAQKPYHFFWQGFCKRTPLSDHISFQRIGGLTILSIIPGVNIPAGLILGYPETLLNFSFELVAFAVYGGRSSSVRLPHVSLPSTCDRFSSTRFQSMQSSKSAAPLQ